MILVFWLVVLAALAPLAGRLTGVEKNDNSSWLPGSAESTEVMNLQSRFEAHDTAYAVVVYQRTSGITTADSEHVAAQAKQFADVDGVDDPVIGPQQAKDGKAIEVLVPITIGDGGWDTIGDGVTRIRDIAAPTLDGLEMHVTGPAGSAADSAKAFEGIDGRLLYATLGVVIVILLLTYRSPVLWLLPVLSAGGALATSEAVIYLFAKHAGLVVNAQSAGILTVLVFGAGTDYALLLVARYREELRRHADRHEAMAYALHRAGPAIVASAATVIAGMLCLLVADLNSTSGLGPVAAIGIAVGLAAMLTLLPALLVICGRWVFWPVRPRFGSPEPTERGVWARIGSRVSSRPRTVWVTTALILGALAVGMVDLNAGPLSNKDSMVGHPDSVVGAEVQAAHFPAGGGQPVVVIGRAGTAGQLRAAVAGTRGILATDEPVVRDRYAMVQGTLADPPDSVAAQNTVDRVRASVHAIPGADAKVGGATAVNMDIERAATHDRNLIIPLVLVVVFVILALLLRALVAPLLLVATVVLSFAAALGASALVFDHLLGFAGVDTSFPLFVFVFLVALGIDYNIFVMTRVREESARHGTRRGALIGLAATGGVITSAGLVLAGTFSVLSTLPLVSFAEIGFAVAFGVLLDTLVVRSILVTALNLDFGRRIWWPSRLDRDGVPAEGEAPPRPDETALAGTPTGL
ncbi:MMPL family transporter [Rugosimonospora africana]|uniref:Putative membrane protein ActII-3 n=1 Tax=Rugosimonospora africana TaxID=556532 RepID=A0A8J3R3N9_9ACTN|nr:MMPL family transporter [Rugosimonospora africana]GIH21224.1 putative membrane protein ActII-3 [Rugosimonospora africana]